MTEIRVERRPPIWPWIVGVLALAAVAWLLIGAFADRPPDEPTLAGRPVEGTAEDANQPAATTGRAPSAIQEYAAFAGADAPDRVSPGQNHEYTAEGIRRLTAALEAHVNTNGDGESRERFERFRQRADRLQQDPQSAEHAATVRDVFTSALEVLESTNVPQDDTSRLRETATAISPDRPLLDQIDRVRQFFRQSSETLEQAATRS